MRLGSLGETNRLIEIRAHEVLDFLGMVREVGQRLLNSRHQGLKGRKVAIMGVPPLDVAPQMLNRVVVGRVRGQLVDRQARSVRGDKLAGLEGGVVARPILDQHDRPLGLRQHTGQKGAVGFGREARRRAVAEQVAREMEVMPDHVHLLLDVDPRVGINNVVAKIKGYTSHELRKEFPWLKKRLPTLWTWSKFISTVGAVTLDVVQQYIAIQKGV